MRTQEHVVAVHRMNDPTPPFLANKIYKQTQKIFGEKNMDYEDLHDTMNRIIDKAQDSIENLVEQYEEQNDEENINKRDIDHAFEALRSSIEMSME